MGSLILARSHADRRTDCKRYRQNIVNLLHTFPVCGEMYSFWLDNKVRSVPAKDIPLSDLDIYFGDISNPILVLFC